mmetsp:Transcript_6351/g.7813  ORF Transcript_6351/g.7813 Transcript_6351/m.7813 type:complete len:86 (-) Transcript_6351:518-775(-)
MHQMKAAKLASRGFPSETKININEIPTLLEAYICPAHKKPFIHLQDAKLKERSTWDTVTHQTKMKTNRKFLCCVSSHRYSSLYHY